MRASPTPFGFSLRKLLAVNTLAQIAGRAVSAVVTLIITIVIARTLGVSGYGDFVKITTFVGLFYLLADFGMNAIYLQDDSRSSWTTLVHTRLLISIVLIVLAILVTYILPSGVQSGYSLAVRAGIVLFVPSILLQAAITSGNAVFQKNLRYDYATLGVGIGSGISLATLWAYATLWAPLTLTGVLLSLLAGSLGTACVGFILANTLQPLVLTRPQMKDVRIFFIRSVPLGLTLLFNLIYFHIDSIVLTVTRPTAEVGIYGLAYKFFELPLVLPTFFMNALYPILLKRNSHHFVRLVYRSGFILCFVSIITVFGMFGISTFLPIIQPEFSQSVTALRVLSLGLPFFFLTSLTMWVIVAKQRQWDLVWIYGGSMISNLILNIWLTPAYGYIAAAWITVACEAAVFIVSLVFVRRLINASNAVQ